MTDQNYLAPEGVDRYVTFKGIDCMGLADAVVGRVMALIDDPQKTNEFWERFREKIRAARDENSPLGTPDALYLVCSHTYYLYDLFEDHDDELGEQLVRAIEDHCC